MDLSSNYELACILLRLGLLAVWLNTSMKGASAPCTAGRLQQGGGDPFYDAMSIWWAQECAQEADGLGGARRVEGPQHPRLS